MAATRPSRHRHVRSSRVYEDKHSAAHIYQSGWDHAPVRSFSNAKGGFGGVQFGYNWRPAQSPWVLGVEADASFGRLRGEDSKPFIVHAGIFGDEAENSIDDKGVARLSQTIERIRHS